MKFYAEINQWAGTKLNGTDEVKKHLELFPDSKIYAEVNKDFIVDKLKSS